MKFTIKKEILLEYLLIVNKGISLNNLESIFNGIYIETLETNEIILKSTNMEIGIETILKAEKVEKKGKIIVPAKYLIEMIKKLPNIDLNFEKNEKNQLKITYGVSEIKLNIYKFEEYPDIHDFIGKTNFSIKGKDLKKGIEKTQISVSNDITRPIFTGILLEIENNKINLVSSDTHRLCYTSINIEKIIKDEKITKIIIPSKSLKEISNILKDEDKIKIHINENRVLFKINNNIKIISRLIEGNFVNYKQVIPEKFSLEIKIIRRILIDTLERAFLLTKNDLRSKLNIVKLNINEKKMIVSSQSLEVGNIYEEIPIYSSGKEIELGFNSKYLIEILKAIESEEVIINLNTIQTPGIIKPNNKENLLYLILPVRL